MRTTARRIAAALVTAAALAGPVLAAAPASAEPGYVPVSGSGSTWSSNALDEWRRNVKQYGMQINYDPQGSSFGRAQFRAGVADFAVSEIPYGLRDGGVLDTPPPRKYAYMPIVAGGTSFMYNLKIGGKRVTQLRLSGEVLAKLFTGVITNWSDPAIKADNPGLTLPARKVVPVVRSDGSGSTAQLATWLATKYPALWDAYCKRAGRQTPCGVTSNYPLVAGSGFVAQSLSLGVAGYVRQEANEGTITYVEYSYARNSGFPVAKVLNKAGYYIEPKAQPVAVGLLRAQIEDRPNRPDYLTQKLGEVYDNPDPRAYPLSSYSYMILPTEVGGTFNKEKGRTLAAFSYYFLCEGQQSADGNGYSPLPINLVRAGLDQVRRIPGAAVQNVDIAKCNNPTFSATGRNILAESAPQPQPCDRKGPVQCGATAGGGPTQTVQPGTGTPSAGASAGPGAAFGASAGPAGPAAQAAVGDIDAIPVGLAADEGWDTTATLMTVSAALLIVLVVGPPLAGRALGRRKRR
jgi:phosphate ABC transporter phosphate-binding protein